MHFLARKRKLVSIPFRENLHSDEIRFLCRELYNSLRFHPFQGKPSFGHIITDPRIVCQRIVSIPFRENLHSDNQVSCFSSKTASNCFHPFQGKPSFGLRRIVVPNPADDLTFPSLSGKTFIRTELSSTREWLTRTAVSIPFRENLHSDALKDFIEILRKARSFHPFQGKPSFGHGAVHVRRPGDKRFHPFQGKPSFGLVRTKSVRAFRTVSIPFRENLHSDTTDTTSESEYTPHCFHPFQGKPSFGH